MMHYLLSLPSILSVLIVIIVFLFAYIKKMMFTFALLIANFLVFFISIPYNYQIINELGFRPIYISGGYLLNWYTLFTSMFVHADYMHILGNMFVLFFVGLAFENRVGRKKFLIIYITTGICGAIAFSLVNPYSKVPVIGASGAIFGILGAFATAYPMDEVVMPVPVGIMLLTRMKVIYAAALFALLETLLVFLSPYMNDNIAHVAHLGGLVSGMILAIILIKRGETKKVEFHHSSGNIEEIVRSPRDRELLEKIRNEDVPEVRDVWLSKLVEDLKCPRCGGKLTKTNDGIFCKNCGLFLRL